MKVTVTLTNNKIKAQPCRVWTQTSFKSDVTLGGWVAQRTRQYPWRKPVVLTGCSTGTLTSSSAPSFSSSISLAASSARFLSSSSCCKWEDRNRSDTLCACGHHLTVARSHLVLHLLLWVLGGAPGVLCKLRGVLLVICDEDVVEDGARLHLNVRHRNTNHTLS